LRPDLRTNDTRPNGKNNLITYTIGFADPRLNTNSILNAAAAAGGGQFFYADNADALANALNTVLDAISSQVGSSASVATNSTQIGSGSAVYQAKFDSGGWFGDLSAFSVDTTTGALVDADTSTTTVLDPTWHVVDRFPNPANRTILTYDPTATGTKGKLFTCANLNASQKTALGIGNDCNSTTDQGIWRLNYIRGDATHEEINAKRSDTGNETRQTSSTLVFRNRTRLDPLTENALTPDPWVLGDIINSNPVYVTIDDYNYRLLPGAEGTSYITFRNDSDYLGRRPMIYVGANDGMLHGFDASMTGSTIGKEMVAYVPNAVYSEFINFSSPAYNHRYFVDGSPTVGDASNTVFRALASASALSA
ncbi:hypothetical protein TI05_16835, partial [Achromatium sp. WMS3]